MGGFLPPPYRSRLRQGRQESQESQGKSRRLRNLPGCLPEKRLLIPRNLVVLLFLASWRSWRLGATGIDRNDAKTPDEKLFKIIVGANSHPCYDSLMLADRPANASMQHVMVHDAAPVRCRCLFSGRVQGVGFGYTVQNIALQYDVSGFVQNLGDGRVEVVLEGPQNEIEQIIISVQHRMTGFIRDFDRTTDSPTGEFEHFSIHH